MATGTVLAARESERLIGRSTEALGLYADLKALEVGYRREVMRSLTARDMAQVFKIADREGGTPYHIYDDDPVGFTEDVLAETVWRKQREVLAAIPRMKRTAVPSCHGVGKTHIAARAAIWSSVTNAPGTALTVTTATRMRQVQRQIWPHIRQAVVRAGLPGSVDMVQWKIPDRSGLEVVVAYGFSAPAHDESAMQGIHAAKLFVVVDEAGGINKIIGSAMRGLLTGTDTRMLLIGNPPTNEEKSWFELLCDTRRNKDVQVIRISAYDSPNLTGEDAGPCMACHGGTPHPLANHLVDEDWVNEAITAHGEHSAYVIARVHGRFPQVVGDKTIPSLWVDLAAESAEPTGDGYVRVCDLGLDGEDETHMVKRGAWVRLGVDVAAGGGDEFVIARAVGDLVTVRYHESGASNAHPMNVAGKVLEEIRAAQALAGALGTAAQIHVKIDSIGVGWGVWGILQAWADEQVHDARVFAVNVAQLPGYDDEASTLRPARKRDEMWLAGRTLLTPRLAASGAAYEPGRLRLRLDLETRAQLSIPDKGTNSQGQTVVESKDKMKARGESSPDRAEAVLLSVYEIPPPNEVEVYVA